MDHGCWWWRKKFSDSDKYKIFSFLYTSLVHSLLLVCVVSIWKSLQAQNFYHELSSLESNKFQSLSDYDFFNNFWLFTLRFISLANKQWILNTKRKNMQETRLHLAKLRARIKLRWLKTIFPAQLKSEDVELLIHGHNTMLRFSHSLCNFNSSFLLSTSFTETFTFLFCLLSFSLQLLLILLPAPLCRHP